jgi:hypothetical protein
MVPDGSATAPGRGPADPSRLLVVCVGAGPRGGSHADDALATISRQAHITGAERVLGYYAAVDAVDEGRSIIVVDLGASCPDRDLWMLAGLRARAPHAVVVALADADVLPDLAGALRADLVVTAATDLPPLRELADVALLPLHQPASSTTTSTAPPSTC